MSEIWGPILPRIRNKCFLEAAKALPGMNADNLPWFEVLAGDLRLTLAAGPPRVLSGREAPASEETGERFAATSPECFTFELRCPKCDSAFVVGCEASRSASGAVRYLPLKAWYVA